jgi:hypothetical protein
MPNEETKIRLIEDADATGELAAIDAGDPEMHESSARLSSPGHRVQRDGALLGRSS